MCLVSEVSKPFILKQRVWQEGENLIKANDPPSQEKFTNTLYTHFSFIILVDFMTSESPD